MDSENLDSLSFHYYDSGYPTFYMYANDIVKLEDQYVLSASTVVGFAENQLRFFMIDAADMRLDSIMTVHQDTFFANSIVTDMEVYNGKLRFGYSDAIAPRPETGPWFRTYYSMVGELDSHSGLFQKIGGHNEGISSKNFLFMENGHVLKSGDEGFHWPSVHMVDEEGHELWEHTDLNITTQTGDFLDASFYEYTQTSDGHILICGRIGYRPYPDMPIGKRIIFDVGYLMKLHSETGEIMWERVLVDYNEEGAPMGFELSDIKELSDGSFIATGLSYPNRSWRYDLSIPLTVEETYDLDTWIIRLSPEGCFLSDTCDGVESFTSSTSEIEDADELGISVYPNPVSETINLNLPSIKGGLLVIRNIEGRIVHVSSSDRATMAVDVKGFSPGQYILEFQYLEAGQRGTVFGKFVKVK